MYCVFEKIYQMIDFVLHFCTTCTGNALKNVPASFIWSFTDSVKSHFVVHCYELIII